MANGALVVGCCWLAARWVNRCGWSWVRAGLPPPFLLPSSLPHPFPHTSLPPVLLPSALPHPSFPSIPFAFNPSQDAYTDPGSPATRRTPWGTYVLALVEGERRLLMQGSGASPEGNR